jgi:hypothetical protein
LEVFIAGTVVIFAVAGAGWPVVAAIAAPALAEPLFDFFLPFFFSYMNKSVWHQAYILGRLTSCQPQTGLKLSKNPTSSNRLGYSHKPGGTANIVMQKRISLKIAITKNNPIKPSNPILRYQTPSRSFIGQSGNMTTANTTAKAPAA